MNELDKVLRYADNLVSMREYSVKSMRQKLSIYVQKNKMDKELISSVIKKLQETDKLNDERYAMALALSYENSKANFFIRNKLIESCVDEKYINKAIGQLKPESIRAKNLLQRRFGMENLDKSDPKEFKKRLNYLLYRGFAMKTAFDVLNKGAQ